MGPATMMLCAPPPCVHIGAFNLRLSADSKSQANSHFHKVFSASTKQPSRTRHTVTRAVPAAQNKKEAVSSTILTSPSEKFGFKGVHHVGVLCENLEKSLEFYCGVLGLSTCNERPADKLPYRGAWLWVGEEMIHLLELPNPDPVSGRPAHGGRDRHTCLSLESLESLKQAFDKAGISYTLSQSGRAAIFARDPDGNGLEFNEMSC